MEKFSNQSNQEENIERQEIIKKADIILGQIYEKTDSSVPWGEANDLIYEWGKILFKAADLFKAGHEKAKYLLGIQSLGIYTEKSKYDNMLEINGFNADSLGQRILDELGTHPIYKPFKRLQELFKGSK